MDKPEFIARQNLLTHRLLLAIMKQQLNVNYGHCKEEVLRSRQMYNTIFDEVLGTPRDLET